MKEFLNIYRFLTGKQSEYAVEDWQEEDIKKLIGLLKVICDSLKNGDIIFGMLVKEIGFKMSPSILENVIKVITEIENRIDENADKEIEEIGDTIVEAMDKLEQEDGINQQQYAEQTKEPMEEINKEIVGKYTMPFKHSNILKRYGNATVYNIVYDDLCKGLLEKFTHADVEEIIDKCYKTKAHKELKALTIETYATRYIEYMKLKRIIKVDKNSGLFVKVPKEEKRFYNRLGMLPDDQTLAKYGTVTIYRPIVDAVLAKLPDEFESNKIAYIIQTTYEKLGRVISLASANVYKGKYMMYLTEMKLIEPTEFGFKKIKGNKDAEADPVVKESVDLVDGETLSEAIYNYAMRSGWKTSIPVLNIERRFPNYTINEIKKALSKLIQNNKARQSDPRRIRFFEADKDI